eukprot:SAG31_NODE_1021_length_10327_cov_17.940653_9_plen_117_part_00
MPVLRAASVGRLGVGHPGVCGDKLRLHARKAGRGRHLLAAENMGRNLGKCCELSCEQGSTPGRCKPNAECYWRETWTARAGVRRPQQLLVQQVDKLSSRRAVDVRARRAIVFFLKK